MEKIKTLTVSALALMATTAVTLAQSSNTRSRDYALQPDISDYGMQRKDGVKTDSLEGRNELKAKDDENERDDRYGKRDEKDRYAKRDEDKDRYGKKDDKKTIATASGTIRKTTTPARYGKKDDVTPRTTRERSLRQAGRQEGRLRQGGQEGRASGVWLRRSQPHSQRTARQS